MKRILFVAFILLTSTWLVVDRFNSNVETSKVRRVQSLNNASGEKKEKTPDFNFSKLNNNQLAIFNDPKYFPITFQKENNVRFSENCFADNYKCIAKSSLGQPIAKTHPAFSTQMGSDKCIQLGGKNLIGLDKNKDEMNVCVFADNSYFYSWDVYYKIHGKAQIN